MWRMWSGRRRRWPPIRAATARIIWRRAKRPASRRTSPPDGKDAPRPWRNGSRRTARNPRPVRRARTRRRARHRLVNPDGKAIYAKREATVETVFGVIKEVMGFRRFQHCGLKAAKAEWTLVSLAWNVNRIYALKNAPAPSA